MITQKQLELLCQVLDKYISLGYRFIRVQKIEIFEGILIKIYLSVPFQDALLYTITIYPSGETNEQIN